MWPGDCKTSEKQCVVQLPADEPKITGWVEPSLKDIVAANREAALLRKRGREALLEVRGKENNAGEGAVRDRGGTVSPSEFPVSAGFLQTARKDWKVLESQLAAEPRDSVCAAPGKVPKVSEREKEQSAKAKRGTEALEEVGVVEAHGGQGTLCASGASVLPSKPFPVGVFLDTASEEAAFLDAHAQHLSVVTLKEIEVILERWRLGCLTPDAALSRVRLLVEVEVPGVCLSLSRSSRVT